MKGELKNILKEASSVLDKLSNGKTYPSNYIVSRFEKAALESPNDQLIGNMKDVLQKVASKQEFITQKEVTSLYDKMYGFSGNRSNFRFILSDLLTDDRQIKEASYSGSKNRMNEEKSLEPIHKDSELSNAFSVLFSLGGNSSFGTFKPVENKEIEKAVLSKTSRLGYTPEKVSVVQQNEHFALCNATYKTSNLKIVSTFIPVQTTGGITKSPEHIVMGGKVEPLDGRNLYLAIKEAEKLSKYDAHSKYASERPSLENEVEVPKHIVPKSLEKFADLENTLVAAASKFDTNKINMAMEILGAELCSFGAFNPDIKIAGSDKKGILFDVHIPTRFGKSAIHVPVEIKDKNISLPSSFASEGNNGKVVFDFSKEGYDRFINSLNEDSKSIKISRDTGTMSSMSYHQLIDKMIDGVSSKDYKLAEDALSIIENKFSSEQFKVAFDQFSQLLKHSSDGGARKKLIKAAYERGDLIKVPNSVELYSPKLGLPLSKVTFDEKGRVIPKRRANSENQIQGTLISTNQILFT